MTETVHDTELETEEYEEYEEEVTTEEHPSFYDYEETGTTGTTLTTLSIEMEYPTTTEGITIFKESSLFTTELTTMFGTISSELSVVLETPETTTPITAFWEVNITTVPFIIANITEEISEFTSESINVTTEQIPIVTETTKHTTTELPSVTVTAESTSFHTKLTETREPITSYITPIETFAAETTPISILPEVTTIASLTSPEVITINEEVTSTEEQYGETETIYDTEYGEEYKETYDEEEEEYEEEESTEIVSPIWHDYIEENFTSTTESIIHVEVTITGKETTLVTFTESAVSILTTASTLSTEIETTLEKPFVTEETTWSLRPETTSIVTEFNETDTTEVELFNITTSMYTLPSTPEFTTESLPQDYLEETESYHLESNITTLSTTEVTLTTYLTSRIETMIHEEERHTLQGIALTTIPTVLVTLTLGGTTNEFQKRTRHRELKIELLEKLEDLETTQEEILEEEEDLQKEEEKWAQEKVRRMNEMIERKKKMKTSSLEPHGATKQPASIPIHGTTIPLKPTTFAPVKPVTFVSTTEDVVEKEVRRLEKQVEEKEKDLKEREDHLLERKHRLQREKEEFEQKMEKMEQELSAGDLEEKMKTESGTTHTTPSLTQLPPTERTTIEIRETTKMGEIGEDTTDRRVIPQTLHEEEEEEKDYDEQSPPMKEKDTTKICLNVLKNKTLGRYNGNVVTERVCLPFVPGESRKGLANEKMKINSLNLKQHEWTEGDFVKDSNHEGLQTESPEDRYKRNNIYQEGNIDPEFRARLFDDRENFQQIVPEEKRIVTRINEVIPMYENSNYEFRNDKFMVTKALGSNKDHWQYDKKYMKRSVLEIDDNDEMIIKNNYETDHEENVLQRPTESTISIYHTLTTNKFFWKSFAKNKDPNKKYDKNRNAHFMRKVRSSQDDLSMDDNSEDDKIDSTPEDENLSDTSIFENENQGPRRDLEDDDENEDSEGTDGKIRKTPGPQWPTEPLTAYHIGGTETWTLEFPEIEKSEYLDDENFAL
ncbi:uncharacterized protein LOC123988297 [Osmia bicornis bicornis]|uniref:uncharacterized protein LOC123988297 n=1 Tax=Osmia bicornis bicornis TaxID=1437191 RepID=UPI001EAF7DF3|nr:uncharacterized protein LOC123988297 [Osmia bicornis bicornis]